MDNPYRSLPITAFWKKAVSTGWNPASTCGEQLLIREGERVASAGSCFAANIIPYIESAGFQYVRTEILPAVFGDLAFDNFSYSKFSAAYGNIYTSRQAVQLIQRALGRFQPKEHRWIVANDMVIDPFRPGLNHPASSEHEFDALTHSHLQAVLESVRLADVFVFTLGLTEAWLSSEDGAVFPVCPGTISGEFDPLAHKFHNFSAREVTEDLDQLIRSIREINPRTRIILTVSPVPLVATATGHHVLPATVYSKSVLRVAAQEATQLHPDVCYFPAYEIVSGPQAPEIFFESDRREPSKAAIDTVMGALLANCHSNLNKKSIKDNSDSHHESQSVGAMEGAEAVNSGKAVPSKRIYSNHLSSIIAQADCEEAALGVQTSKPIAGRLFRPDSRDMVDFGLLSPFQDDADWSIVSLIFPVAAQHYSGIISKRTDFCAGKNQFTFWLKNGRLGFEADDRARSSNLTPELGVWSYAAVTSSKSETVMHLGSNGKLSEHTSAPFSIGNEAPESPLIIGKMGNTFPGSIAFVCIYKMKLPRDLLKEICTGCSNPLSAPGLVFAWVASKQDEDRDLLTARTAFTQGTEFLGRHQDI